MSSDFMKESPLSLLSNMFDKPSYPLSLLKHNRDHHLPVALDHDIPQGNTCIGNQNSSVFTLKLQGELHHQDRRYYGIIDGEVSTPHGKMIGLS